MWVPPVNQTPDPTLSDLWESVGFKPNPNQAEAILHTEGPLYLPAGPGSGKTRVLLWRALNLIVFHGVLPEEIYLSTFTEKAALQLKEGLRALLGHATRYTGRHYDIAPMYIGTVHSLCLRLIADRRFAAHRRRVPTPVLLDQVDQYFHIARRDRWSALLAAAGFSDDGVAAINAFFGKESESRYQAIQNCISLFNRLSEECLDPHAACQSTRDPFLRKLLAMYAAYLDSLRPAAGVPYADLSLLQQRALDTLHDCPTAGSVFKHVIIDEYQDTNTIQERLFFTLAAGHRNICVVGDDDQALYRFRGATVENFVQFPDRCQAHLQCTPRTIPLTTNYRSRQQIVEFYNDFIAGCNWSRTDRPNQAYRVTTKVIQPHRQDAHPAVVATEPSKAKPAFDQIARLVKRLLDTGKVEDPNQIAFLFPSLKSVQVGRMREALELLGLRVYAPRAQTFLQVDESVAMFGLIFHILGRPAREQFAGADYNEFHNWLDAADAEAVRLTATDPQLRRYVQDRRNEIAAVLKDRDTLLQVIQHHRWQLDARYDLPTMKRVLVGAAGLSDRARAALASRYFDRLVERRAQEGRPVALSYAVRRASSLDWNVLDLFYRLCGFAHFKTMFDLAEQGIDEGPICNLGLISQYLARFTDKQVAVITADILADDRFTRLFVYGYLYTLFRMGESEYEDAEDPFPRGRIPFLTIHQAKGLEFPVVVLANPCKRDRGPQKVEQIVHPLLAGQREPLDRLSEFDIMRLFYVALSRPQNLLVIADLKGRGLALHPVVSRLLEDGDVTRIPNFDPATVPPAATKADDLPKTYSYTGDYLLYQKCPRQYMIFRRYGFVPSRSQIMVFGSLVHRTLEDLHQHLIDRRTAP